MNRILKQLQSHIKLYTVINRWGEKTTIYINQVIIHESVCLAKDVPAKAKETDTKTNLSEFD